MRTSTKILIIAAISLILVGSMIFGCVMLMLNWDITKLSTDKYETNEHEISESFSSISVVTETASIVFLPSDNEKCSVVCYEEEKGIIKMKQKSPLRDFIIKMILIIKTKMNIHR